MLFTKYLLLVFGAGLLAAAAGAVIHGAYLLTKSLERPIRWRLAGKLAIAACVPILLGLSIVVVPAGMAGVRVSEISGTQPGTLYPGVHWVVPLIERVVVYDIRDHVFTTEDARKKLEPLKVQSKEGLVLGLAISVRYRLDSKRLAYIHANLPQPVEEEIVPPVVASVFRQVIPNYLVRDVFSTRREEVRRLSAQAITQKLGTDGIVVKEVMLRDILLPPEYAKGLEGLMLIEQENERLAFEIEIKQKMVRTAELEAEAEKARKIKHAEADSQVTVLRAKAESDAMQYMLPLKEKQIQQTRLEAEARKESTVKNAEALAQAKVIDSRAELERGKLMAESEANRIRVTTAADAERLKVETAALKESPLLIQKIIAERLSDRVQIIMVPADGKFFFANDVLKGVVTNPAVQSGLDDGAGRHIVR
jgi:regulator of protease activity HflC (stomatin/prohibitin superfamily)